MNAVPRLRQSVSLRLRQHNICNLMNLEQKLLERTNHYRGFALFSKEYGHQNKSMSTNASPSPTSSTSKESSPKGAPSSKKETLLTSIVAPEPLDPPIPYRTSAASRWRARDTHLRTPSNSPPYEPLVIALTFMVFLLYFCVLREENDIDEEMKKSLWERVPGLERKQLDVVLNYNEQMGLPTSDIKKRIQELDAAREK